MLDLELTGSNTRVVRQMREWSRWLGFAVAVLGLSVLVGWATNSETLKSVLPGAATMKANTALGFVLLGASIILLAGGSLATWRRWTGVISAGLAGAIGLLTILEYATGWDLRLDELIFADAVSDQTSNPGRTSAGAAASLLALGVAVALIDTIGRRLSQLLSAAVLVGGAIAALGYLYGASDLYQVSRSNSTAVHAAAGLVAAAAGVLLLRPERLTTFVGRGGGGIVLRRALPRAVLAFVVIAKVRIELQQAGYIEAEFGLAMVVIMSSLVMAAIVWRVARLLDHIDARREHAVTQLRDLNRELEDRVRSRTVELTLSESRFESLLDGAPDAMVIVDADGAIVLVNERTEQMFGYRRDELLGRGVETLLPERSRSVHSAHRDVYAASPVAREMGSGLDLHGRRKDASEFPVEIFLSPLRSEQGLTVSASVRDVTRRHELSRQLQAANSELDSFAYSVAHDLRSPLRSIDGFSQALLEDYNHILDVDGQDYLQRVRAAAQRMGTLIDDLLALSRVTLVDLEVERTDLSELARRVTDDLRSTDTERSTPVFIADGLLATADPGLAEVVLRNLLDNAWKFTSTKPEAAIRVDSAPTPGWFCVSDDGVGFDMVHSDRLFTAFKRLHAASEFPGSGVGLATVRRVLRRHGGDVTVEAEIDRGARFTFTFGSSGQVPVESEPACNLDES